MQKQILLLNAEAILKYFLGDDKIETLVQCPPEDKTLVTYDQSVYEAMGSLSESERKHLYKLVKLLETVHIYSFAKEMQQSRKILTHERVDELRRLSQCQTT